MKRISHRTSFALTAGVFEGLSFVDDSTYLVFVRVEY